MSDMVRATQLDLDEAFQCGLEAVKLAEAGETGYMVSMIRISDDPYVIEFGKALLNDVAVKAKPMPLDYFNEEGNFVTDNFLSYAKPLIGELPDFVELEKKFV
jgi:6-phosphofructokinase 1